MSRDDLFIYLFMIFGFHIERHRNRFLNDIFDVAVAIVMLLFFLVVIKCALKLKVTNETNYFSSSVEKDCDILNLHNFKTQLYQFHENPGSCSSIFSQHAACLPLSHKVTGFIFIISLQ